ncbi:MAG: acyl-CoA dehydrogenase family protein [Actinomycetaceae bacterium]|nr:acyl-CoA dehydrogenase family protein [Actinomycetaceae bacterium]
MAFLKDDLLERIHSRAAKYDEENTFPYEDYEELKEAGYYRAFVPKEYGGEGLTLAEIAKEQTRLAKAAPGTALGINMHQIIVGLGRHMVARGDMRGEQILRGAAAGELYGFGISEPRNDKVLLGSLTEARPDGKGGYSFYGQKVFTSLAPAWTKLMTFGEDSASEDAPKSVFAILDRENGGFSIADDWDTLGMKATQSNSTLLEGAHADEDAVLARQDPGPSLSPVFLGIYGNFEILLAATYAGIGDRAVEIAVETVKKRRSVMNDAPYSDDPDIRRIIATAAVEMDGIHPHIEHISNAFEALEDRGFKWLPQLSAVKHRSAEAALFSVQQAVRASGGSSYYNSKELSRLYRDVLAGLFQPSDAESTYSGWAAMLLGPKSK